MNKTIELGQKVKDSVTGYTGIATARTTYLYSTPRICVEAQGLTDELEPVAHQWFDEPRLIVVTE